MKGTQMILRLAFVIALLVGLGGLLGFWAMTPVLRDVHIVTGLMVLVSAGWLAFQVKNPTVAVGALLILLGGILPLIMSADSLAVRVFHLVVMIVALGLVEMGVGRALRART
ncbi:hypothetical protein [Sulfobacillus harzensis]|uniref:DUF4405 domain-containing protein n=1 Tax=Sulfobacillus harzensis TaxID=2729629 RepID=A0A7Y0Q3B6_9FIRM|nr:hypothetical protein [Sulfobacillus harzensis]NMP23387.1 hypothetical protein [Sulfobacillus harzensis]